MELEWRAADADAESGYPFDLVETTESNTEMLLIDTRPLIRAVAEDVNHAVVAPLIARRFQTGMVDLISNVCGRLRKTTGLETVVLSGGVFMNVMLTRETCARLAAAGFRVYRHRLVPPNDGGLSLGQLAIAAQTVVS